MLQGTNPGGIVCLHDGRDISPNPDISQTLAAVRHIVPLRRDKGYTFETVVISYDSLFIHLDE